MVENKEVQEVKTNVVDWMGCKRLFFRNPITVSIEHKEDSSWHAWCSDFGINGVHAATLKEAAESLAKELISTYEFLNLHAPEDPLLTEQHKFQKGMFEDLVLRVECRDQMLARGKKQGGRS